MNNNAWKAIADSFGTIFQGLPQVNDEFRKKKLKSDWDSILKDMPSGNVQAQSPADELATPDSGITKQTLRDAYANATAPKPRDFASEVDATQVISNIGQNANQGVGAIDNIAGDEPIDKEKAREILRNVLAQKESGNNLKAKHPAYNAKGDRVLGKFGIHPGVWFDKIGLKNTPNDRTNFENSEELQNKGFDAVFDEYWPLSGGDFEKFSKMYYGGPSAAKADQNRSQVVFDGSGAKPIMPSFNAYWDDPKNGVKKLLMDNGVDPSKMTVSQKAQVVKEMVQQGGGGPDARTPALSALDELIRSKPTMPKMSRREKTSEQKLKYILEKIDSPEMFELAQPTIKSLQAMAQMEHDPYDELQSQYKNDKEDWLSAVKTGAGLEENRMRYEQTDKYNNDRQKSLDQKNDKANTIRALTAEAAILNKQLSELQNLSTQKLSKLSDEQKASFQAQYGQFMKTRTEEATFPWSSPSAVTEVDESAVQKHATALRNGIIKINEQLANLSGGSYSVDMPNPSSPENFFLE